MWLIAYVWTRKRAKELAELVASGQALARVGRTHEAKTYYIKARKFRRTVRKDLGIHFGPKAAHNWDDKSAHMLTSLATSVSAWEV